MTYGIINSNRQWLRALVCFVIGFPFLMIGLILAFSYVALQDGNITDDNTAPLAFFGGLMSAYLSYVGIVQLFNCIRCLKSRSANRLTLVDMDNDTRAPVLYLRPFTVDNAVMSSGARVLNIFNPFSWYKLRRTVFGGLGSFLKLRWTIEQVVEYATRKIGPLVAIGQPGSPPVMGAHNLFVGEEWKERIEELARRAQLIILVAGATTPGLMWEMEFIRSRADPGKFMIFVPGGRYRWWWPFWRVGSRRRNWNSFRKASEKVFPLPLPERLRRGAAFVGFGADWQPSLVDPRRRPPMTQVRDYLAFTVMKIL